MFKSKRKDLIQCRDYPRDTYGAYWNVFVDGSDSGGWVFKAELMAYEIIGWFWNGKGTVEFPEGVKKAVYPKAPKKDASPRMHAEHRELCSKIYERHPKPMHLLDKEIGDTDTRDEALDIAQKWVLANIEKYKRPEVSSVN